MSDTNISSLVLKKGEKRYIFNPKGDLDLSNYYTKSEIDNKLSGYATTSSLSSYALKTELPNTSNFATKTDLNSYATTSSLNSVKTTANNALSVANSKATFNINKSKPYDTNTAISSINTNKNLYIRYIKQAAANEDLNITVNGLLLNSADFFSGDTRTTLYGSNQALSFGARAYVQALEL